MSNFEVDVAGATEAFDAAGGVEHLLQNQDPQTPAPATPVQPVTPATPAQPRDPSGRFAVPAPDQPVVPEPVQQPEPFSGLDPNTLPEELQSVYRSMQGDYTRKTQALAERSRAYDAYGEPEFVEQAVQVYQQLQDPSNWAGFHQELSQAMQQNGLSPAAADAAASEEVARQQSNEQGGALQGLEALNDPDLAPVKSAFEGLQKQVTDMQESLKSQQQEQQVEQLQQAVLGELTRQENIIRQTNPTYTDDDVDFAYELSSFYDGNLIDAQNKLEQYVQSRLTRYLEAKQGAVAPLPGGAVTSVQAPVDKPATLDDAHALAMEQIRQMEAAGQI